MPQVVGYRQLDTSSTYDREFREPATTDDGSQLGSDGRVESAEIKVPAQFNERFFERLAMYQTGDEAVGAMIITHHSLDLERLGLLDSDGRPTIKKSDRVAAIYRKRSQAKILEIRNPPGLFVREVRPSGWGMGDHINLWDIIVGDRGESFE
jgi:hypothetical protein